MDSKSVRPTDTEIENTVNSYADALFRLCFSILRSTSDAEDATSDTFVKYITKAPLFYSEEHKKAWLIKVAVNICKDMLRSKKRHNQAFTEEMDCYCETQEDHSILEAVMTLPVKYKTVIHLFYIEGYKTEEISKILSLSPAAVRKRLQYAREALREKYREEL